MPVNGNVGIKVWNTCLALSTHQGKSGRERYLVMYSSNTVRQVVGCSTAYYYFVLR